MKKGPWIVKNVLRLFVVGLCVLGAFIFIMLMLLKVDITVPAQGVVRCSKWINVTTEIEGVIKQVNVVEGQWIEKGDPLFKLEQRELELNVEEAKLKIDEYQSAVERTQRQLIAIRLDVNAEIEEASAMETQAKAKLRIVHKGARAEEIKLAEGRVRRAKEYFNKATMDLERKQKSLALKIIPRKDVEEASHKKRLARVEVAIEEGGLALLHNKYDANDIVAAEAELKAAAARKKRAVARRSEALMQQDDLDQILSTIQKEKKRLKVYEQRLELTLVRAPMAGTVLTHEPEHLAGQDVSEGTSVIRLGDCSKFNIDCRVSERNVPLVVKGLPARVEVIPFPKGEYRLFSAEVIGVGADSQTTAITEGKHGVPVGLGENNKAEGYFPVLLELDEPYSMYLFGETYFIKPGFSTEVEIIISKERLATTLVRRILRIGGAVKPDNLHL